MLALAIAVFAVTAAPVRADGFVTNGEGWLALSPVERMAYIQGINDSANFIYSNDDLATAIVKVARTRCLIDNSIAPNILADIITTAYTNQPALRIHPPLYIYVTRLTDICRQQINVERGRMGQPPI